MLPPAWRSNRHNSVGHNWDLRLNPSQSPFLALPYIKVDLPVYVGTMSRNHLSKKVPCMFQHGPSHLSKSRLTLKLTLVLIGSRPPQTKAQNLQMSSVK
jgi:hypothetical protein